MVGRTVSSPLYRYGFNGKEKDDEAKGSGAQYDYGMRVYDPRVGKFLSRDPLTKDYPELTPYQFASNTPIRAIDLDGGEMKDVIEFGWGPESSRRADIQRRLSIKDGNEWLVAPAAIVTFASVATLLEVPAAINALTRWGVNISSNPRNIYIFSTASAFAAKYGPDIANLAYGVATGDANEPIPTNTGTQSADAGVLFRGLFKAPVNISGWLKNAGVETAILTKGVDSGPLFHPHSVFYFHPYSG